MDIKTHEKACELVKVIEDCHRDIKKLNHVVDQINSGYSIKAELEFNYANSDAISSINLSQKFDMKFLRVLVENQLNEFKVRLAEAEKELAAL